MLKQITIAFFLLIVLAFTCFSIYRMWKPKSEKFSKKKAILSLLFLWYLCGVAAMTIIPLRTSWTQNLEHHFNFIPVINSYRRYFLVHWSNNIDAIRNYYGNLFGNIALFIPFGIFVPWLYKKRLLKVILISGLSSCLIEFVQYLNMFAGYYRYVDVDDIILNTLGAIIGYWFFKQFLHAREFSRL